MGRAERITSIIQGHDIKLYCARNTAGTLCIYRKSQRVETFFMDEGYVIHSVRPAPHFVCALTHNWGANGRPVDWGLEPILKKIRSSDLWSRDIVGDLEKQEEMRTQSLARDRKNSIESFFSEYRNEFKETFKDVNVSTLDKNKKIKHFHKE